MTTEAAPPPGSAGTPPATPAAEEFVRVQQSAEFAELRSAQRNFAFPLTVAFIAWYLLYVLLSSYAGGFMGTKLFGNINVALVLGLAQFATTFLIAWLYSRHAAAKLDPKASAIKARMEAGA
ncbi:membrane protein [Streptomyces avidinii]